MAFLLGRLDEPGSSSSSQNLHVEASDNAGALERLALAVLGTEVHETCDAELLAFIQWLNVTLFSPGISFSERTMSLRPQAARAISATWTGTRIDEHKQRTPLTYYAPCS